MFSKIKACLPCLQTPLPYITRPSLSSCCGSRVRRGQTKERESPLSAQRRQYRQREEWLGRTLRRRRTSSSWPCSLVRPRGCTDDARKHLTPVRVFFLCSGFSCGAVGVGGLRLPVERVVRGDRAGGAV
jgi:hypothetical protein